MWQRPTGTFAPSRGWRKGAPGKASKRARTQNELVVSEYEPQTLIIQDHNGNDAILAWCSKFYDEDSTEKVPPFPFQVYLTNNARNTVKDIEIRSFAERFVSFIEFIGGVPHHSGHCAEDRCSQRQCRHGPGFHEDEYGSRNFKDYASFCHYRFEIYSKPLTNVLACVAHQRREIQYRNRNGVDPQLVSSWTTLDFGYKGRIIVIDRDDWETAGVVLVGFDPVPYDRYKRYIHWNVAQKGDHPLVEAGLLGAKSILRERLRAWWVNAGHSWTEAHLDRRNKGAITPVLYPAIDPAAHHDAEHEDVHELADTSLPGPAVQPDLTHSETGEVCIQDMFNHDELWQSDDDLKHLQSETYSDCFGLPVTSIWNTKWSSLRPLFSVTIYMTFDIVLPSNGLFSCLDKGLIAKEPWTLDIVRNMPSLEAAFDYHARASSSRTPERTKGKASCIQNILIKVAGNKLAVELLDYIKVLVVPPEIPNYSSRPTRIFRDVFLFLDASSLYMGPQLVYSNPASFWPDRGSSKGPFTEPRRWSSAFMREYASQDPLLQVVNLRYWHRVADEIHILWSFCSARLATLSKNNFPRISLHMNLPDEIQHGHFADVLTQSELRYELHFTQPITLPMPALSHWGLFEIVDLDTNTTIPNLPFRLRGLNSCSDSWSQSKELGFKSPQFQTLWPNSLRRKLPSRVQCGSQDWREPYLWADALLTKNHRYTLRLRDSVQIPRWILGTSQGGGHPFNLPPIDVTMSNEAQLTFRYIGST